MDDALVSETLEALSDVGVARKMRRQVHTLRGIRGTPLAEVARVAAATWVKEEPTLDAPDGLYRLYGNAWEDGLVAIGLVAARVADDPALAFDIGLEWLERVDDVQTADALGWLVLGPGFAAAGGTPEALRDLITPMKNDHPMVRRALAAMGLAFLPLPIEGASAAPLRERHGGTALQMVDSPLTPLLHTLCHLFLRDEAPQVRKVMRRLLRVWVKTDPDSVVAWVESVRGGLPKFLSAETKKATHRGSS